MKIQALILLFFTFGCNNNPVVSSEQILKNNTAIVSFNNAYPYVEYNSVDTLEKDTLFVNYKGDSPEVGRITDTFLFESFMDRHYLVGSQILPGTEKQLSLWGYDLALVDVAIEACSKKATNVSHERANYFRDSIVYFTQTDSSLKVHVAVSGNCCHRFLFDAEVDTSGILNLIYIGYGSYCACNCGVCFSYEFIFPGYGYKKEEDIQDIRGIMLNGKKKTLLKIKKE